MKTVVEYLEDSLALAKTECDTHRQIFADFTKAALEANYKLAGLTEMTRNVNASFALVYAHNRILLEAKARNAPTYQWAIEKVKDVIACLAYDVDQAYVVEQIRAFRKILTFLEEKVDNITR